MDIDDDEEMEDPLSIGGGTQQTCDACRTVMDQLLQEWHTFDNDAFLEAIDEAAHRNEYVPVVPEDEVAFRYNIESIERTKGIREESRRQVGTNSIIVILRFMKRCKNVDIWIQYTWAEFLTHRYKPHIRKACIDIVKKSGSEIAHILVDKNAEVDTDIMNCMVWVIRFIYRFDPCGVYGFKSTL